MFSMFSPAKDSKAAIMPPHRLRSFKGTRPITPRELKDRDTIVRVVPAMRAGSSSSSSDSVLVSSMNSSLYSYLVDPKVVYTFRMVQLTTYTASVNVIANYYNLDPSGTNEYSNLSNLFAVYRVVGARFTVIPLNSGSTSTTNGRPWVIIAPEVGLSSTAPSNGQAALDGPASRMISLLPGYRHSDYVFDFPKGILPLNWQTFGGGQEPYAGGWGQFSIYGQTAGASDSFQSTIEIFVECSGRT